MVGKCSVPNPNTNLVALPWHSLSCKIMCGTLCPLASGHMANHWISLLIYSLSRSFLQPQNCTRNMGQRSRVLFVEEK